MEKILFIVPPYVNYDSFVHPAFNDGTMTKESGKYRNIVADMPMGLLSLSAYLKKHADVQIKVIDFNIVLHKMKSFHCGSFSELFRENLSKKEWLDYEPTIIGISTLFSPSYYNMLEAGEVARKLFPEALLVGGGGVPSNMYKEIFKDSTCWDALCYGEGERPLLGLVKAPDKKEFLNAHASWITRRKLAEKARFEFDFINDLDEIPFWDYDLVDIEDYRINPVLATFPLAQEKMKSMPVLTSRGCPHRCCFCASHTVHGRAMRYHSLGRVREDFQRLSEQYGARAIVFFDDHLMSDKQRVFKIVDILNELKLTAFFPASLALYALDRKILEALKSVGLDQLVLSVESGSDRVLREVMHKPLNLSIVSRVIRDCRELGIAADVAILLGLPGETKKDIEDTRAFLKTLDATWFRINIATPLVGSEMLEICLKKNYIKGDYLDCDFKRAVVETEDFTPEYLQEKIYALNLELNFVGNSDFRLGNYGTALKGFENTIRVKNDHALAYYCAAKCCKKLNLAGKYLEYKAKYGAIVKSSAFWRDYAKQFDLAPLE